MSYKYGLSVPATGSNKIPRFNAWARENVPDVEYKLPPQVPVKAETLAIRLRSPEHRDQLLAAFPTTLP